MAVTKAQDVAGNELLECPFDTGSEIEFYTAEIGISGLPDSCDDNDLITIGMFIQDVVDEVEARMPQYQGEKSITLVCPFPKNTLEDKRRGLQERTRYRRKKLQIHCEQDVLVVAAETEQGIVVE